MTENLKWGWWIGGDEERYDYGPFISKEDAVKEGQSIGDYDEKGGFYVVEAVEGKLFFKVLGHDVLDRIEEINYDRIMEDSFGYNGIFEHVTKEQRNSLTERLTHELKQWAKEENITINCPTLLFEAARNKEWIKIEDCG